jgi:hypothetical protein
MTSTRSSNPSRLRLGRSYRLAPEPDGSPLFTPNSLVACWRYGPREHLTPLALARAEVLPSPLSDRVGYSDHDRFRGYLPVHFIPACKPPCLRFAAAVTGRHARLGTRLLARLCRDRHLRRLSCTHLQGATLIEPDVPISGIRLSDWLHCRAHDGTHQGRRSRHSTPRSPCNTAKENLWFPRPATLCRLARNARARSRT